MHSPQDYIPAQLKSLVFHSHDDIYVCGYFNPNLIHQLMKHGFLPIAYQQPNGQALLLPKLHANRCVLELKYLKFNKRLYKKPNYTLNINVNFDKVVQGIRNQHKNCWLIDELVQAFKLLPNVVSIEIYNGNELVAGELGYIIGSVYTSLSGFYTVSSSGSIQLLALGALLRNSGFVLWDFGMTMDYKLEMGAIEMPRDDFLKEYKDLSLRDCQLITKEQGTKELIRSLK